MKQFSIILNIFKYSKLKYIEGKIFEAKDKSEAKQIAKDFTASTEWAFDLTPVADLRTLKIVR